MCEILDLPCDFIAEAYFKPAPADAGENAAAAPSIAPALGQQWAFPKRLRKIGAEAISLPA